MLFTRESDYAIRIVRALRFGEKRKAKDICDEEDIPEAFAYKIIKKLEQSGIVNVIRGTRGGCILGKDLGDIYLYDIILAVDPDFSLIRCMRHSCSRDIPASPCKVHQEMARVQNVLEKELKNRSIKEILEM